MSSNNPDYEKLKIIAESCVDPCAVMSVEKNPDGTCGEIRIVAANDKFSMTGENTEGELYTKFIRQEAEFDDMCFKSAFEGERFHTYIDTTELYGGWSENLILPLKPSSDGKTGYCQFIYGLDEEMQPDKFSAISPIVAGFVMKTSVSLKKGADFKANLNEVLDDLRNFADAVSVCVVSADNEKKKAEIIGQSIRDGSIAAEQLFSEVPFEIVEAWDEIIGDSNSFIIRDMSEIENNSRIPDKWANLLKTEGASNVCLVPLSHEQQTKGYLIISSFDAERESEIKETAKLMALFLASEMANSEFLKRLEWLTSLDMLTGVRNRAAMNRVVDELDARLKYQKAPFGVAICAMNGLKALNAEGGHDAGNEALAKAGEILRGVFKESQVFRSAGEEFSVVAEGISKEKFEEKIGKLRELGSDPEGVHLSIGWFTDEDTGDIRAALRESYQQMRKEKNSFYEKYPEKKR
ncbi:MULTISPECIES: GGDEF domain-containing protein [unclassified Butyrivibrio]|uniref:GGDEF domain-containing protein n=1 Tax=unclassified Butyrivibrio TaxID=2639466 RepID=UPI00041C8D90|nr:MULTISPECIES: GGDEF domain-containing protein [unclassified Butyrivibrio]